MAETAERRVRLSRWLVIGLVTILGALAAWLVGSAYVDRVEGDGLALAERELADMAVLLASADYDISRLGEEFSQPTRWYDDWVVEKIGDGEGEWQPIPLWREPDGLPTGNQIDPDLQSAVDGYDWTPLITVLDPPNNDRRFLSYSRKLDAGSTVVLLHRPLVEVDSDVADARTLAWIVGALAPLLLFAAMFLATRRMKTATTGAAINRENFLADTAHELRTPLSVIQVAASHALVGERDETEYRLALTEVRAAAERAARSIGELMDLARLESGQIELRPDAVRLDLLVEEVAATVGDKVTVIDAAEISAKADYPLLRRATNNVVQNAVARASKVTVTVRAAGRGQAQLVVSDNGPGFTADMLDRAPQKFGRGDDVGTAGIGLSMASAIVEAHGGQIMLANEPSGGAIVTFLLPIAKSNQGAPA